MKQSVLAFAAAPFFGTLFATPVISALFGDFRSCGLYCFFGMFLAYAAALLFGAPLYLVIRRLVKNIRLWHAALGGMVCSLPVIAIWLYPFESLYFQRSWQINLALALGTGLTSGAFFWAILWAPLKAPDRSIASKTN